MVPSVKTHTARSFIFEQLIVPRPDRAAQAAQKSQERSAAYGSMHSGSLRALVMRYSHRYFRSRFALDGVGPSGGNGLLTAGTVPITLCTQQHVMVVDYLPVA